MISRRDLRLVIVVLLLVLTGGVRLRAEGENRDPKAVEVTRAMMQAMGGEDAWNSAHFVRFDFKFKMGGKLVVDNAHLWDRKDGRYRFEYTTKDGKRQVALFRIADYERNKSGEAYLDGKKLEGDAARKAVDDASVPTLTTRGGSVCRGNGSPPVST